MTINRMSLVSSLDPDVYSNGIITAGASAQNVLYTNYPGPKIYASQRPAIGITTEPSDDSQPDTQGRGITYWDAGQDFYFVREAILYKGDYTNSIATVGSAGNRDKVFFTEVGDYLVLIDPEENKGWTIHSSTPSTVVAISDLDFPPNQGPALQLAGGAVSLDGYLFVLTTDGITWNSNLNDPTTWTALDFIGSDIEADGGVYIAKHHNHVCVIGTGSIEYYYDAGNPVGSPLQLRQDISYLTGAVEYNAVSTTGEEIVFLGREASGTIGLYKVSSFKLSRISNDSIERYLGDTYASESLSSEAMKFIVTSSWIGQHLLCFLTAVSVNDTVGDPDYTPIYTLVFDSTNDLWVRFSSELDLIPEFGVMGVTEPTGDTSRKGSIMFISGSIGSFDVSGIASDYRSSDGYIVRDPVEDAAYSTDLYWAEGYIVSAPDSGTNNICMNITTVETDFDKMTYKNCHRMSVAGTSIASAGDLTPIDVSWTDDRYRTFSTPRQLDTGLRRSLTRLGSFRRRAYSLDYCGADLLKLEFLEFDTRESQYA